ncbi:MAG: PepSY domain-containing protein [Rhizobium sp.]|nr:PepSY domain-containing protein [Rhizobium sp.]MBW8446224.1 PepSY domain-containing protein [Arenimonas sp.]
MKTIIAATAVIASLAGASAAFAFEPTNGPRAKEISTNVDRTVVGSIIRDDGAKADRAPVDSSNLNVIYGFDSGRGLKVGTSSHD